MQKNNTPPPPTTSTGGEGYIDICIYAYIYILYTFAHTRTTYVYKHSEGKQHSRALLRVRETPKLQGEIHIGSGAPS